MTESLRLERARAAFTDIYENNNWGFEAGIEPEPEKVREFICFLQNFIRQNEVKTIAEFGCGFFIYSRQLDLTGISYNGYDVVESLLQYDTENFGSENVHFHALKNGMKISGADLVICKDVFQHLPTDDVIYYLSMFKKLYKYLLITNDAFADAESGENENIPNGGYRAIRLDKAPFNEHCAVLHEWEGVSFGKKWTKHTCLILGDFSSDSGAQIVLRIDT